MIPEVADVLSAEEVRETAEYLAELQQPSGLIPWFPGGHCDPWNHVESAMALDVAGMHRPAEAAYEWLADVQRPNGSWHNYYGSDGSVEEDKLDTNVCAYIATGVWHHWRCTWDRAFLDHLWPTVERALDWTLSLRRPDGLVLWAVEADGTRTWDYALLTGTSSIQHAFRCGVALADIVGEPHPEWERAADVMVHAIAERPLAFEPKVRWAMDWYYPVLTGALTGEAAKARLAEGWDVFAMEGRGIRCVSDEPWVTASETAECAVAFAAIGDRATATELLAWTRAHRREDGSYWTGLVYDSEHPDGIHFPFEEHTSYTAAAVILAADAITGASPAAALFTPRPAPRLNPGSDARWVSRMTPNGCQNRRGAGSVDAVEDPQRAGGGGESEAAALEGREVDLLVRRAAAVGGVREDVVDRQRPADRHVWCPAGVVGAGRLDAVPAVDEHQGRRHRPVAGDHRRLTDHRHDPVLQPGVRIVSRNVGSVSISPVRASTSDGVVVLPAGLVLLRAAVVVDSEHDRARLTSGRAEPDRRAAAVRPDLDERRTRHRRRSRQLPLRAARRPPRRA